jgi:hypothetical protein
MNKQSLIVLSLVLLNTPMTILGQGLEVSSEICAAMMDKFILQKPVDAQTLDKSRKVNHYKRINHSRLYTS